MPYNPYGHYGDSSTPIHAPHTGRTGRNPFDTVNTADLTSGVGSKASSVDVGASIADLISTEVITEPGIESLPFYSLTNAAGQMLVPGAAAALSITLPFRGSIIGLSFNSSSACSGTYSIYLGGVATAAELVESAATSDYQAWAKGAYGFAAGTDIDVRASSVTTSAVVLCIAYVIVDPSPVS